MKKKQQLYASIFLLIAFVLWTGLLRFIDVKPIGPNNSSVGLASVNEYVHNLLGVNMTLYTVTDYLGLVPIAVALCFAIFGLIQWIKVKRFLSVDRSILVLGIFYTVVISVYILFEFIQLNYRPVLINGYLEASYPSSTTMLVVCVMEATVSQLKSRIKNTNLKKITVALIEAFILFMVLARLLSGVHWLTDIIGSLLLSIGLVKLYNWISSTLRWIKLA